MPAFAIGHITVLNPDLWDEYRSRVPATLEGTGGELMFRATTARVLGGSHAHEQTVVIRFPDLATLNRWFDSDAYQALVPLRERAAKVDLVAFA
ncbi:MAG: hypothetical protein RL758_1933 [Pseudomonadota bacterium]|jgi:uncharacterized protein (DUF1330 family)